MKAIARNITSMLDINKMTQKELADKVGVDFTTVSSWCSGRTTPRMDKIDKLCSVFGCRRSDLLEDDVTKDTLIRAGKSKELYALIEKMNNTGMDRLIEYAKELSKLYGD